MRAPLFIESLPHTLSSAWAARPLAIGARLALIERREEVLSAAFKAKEPAWWPAPLSGVHFQEAGLLSISASPRSRRLARVEGPESSGSA